MPTNIPQAAITALAERAAEGFLARYLKETGKPGTLHDCTVFKVGYTDGLSEAARELTAAIRTLSDQLAAQRAIVAADEELFALEDHWQNQDIRCDNPHDTIIFRGKRDSAIASCRELREEAKRIDEGSDDEQTNTTRR